MIKVLLCDDDSIVRASLETILNAQDDIMICGSVCNGYEAVLSYKELQPDILLMDIQMPKYNGIEAAKDILSCSPDAKIVFLTTFSDDAYIVQALRLGVKGYLIKQEVSSIAPALRSVVCGQMVLGLEVVGKVAQGMHLDEKELCTEQKSAYQKFVDKAKLLTERELEIASLVAQGLNNKEIAEQLFISDGTLRNHISVILQKLELKNRTQLAIYYYQ